MDALMAVVKDCRVKISEDDTEKIYGLFDPQNTGSFDYSELIAALLV